jgi:hypothetical protein
MTAKEKARELVSNYRQRLPFYSDKGATANAKQCALILVREILKITWVDKFLTVEEYWKEVKSEIEKL